MTPHAALIRGWIASRTSCRWQRPAIPYVLLAIRTDWIFWLVCLLLVIVVVLFPFFFLFCFDLGSSLIVYFYLFIYFSSSPLFRLILLLLLGLVVRRTDFGRDAAASVQINSKWVRPYRARRATLRSTAWSNDKATSWRLPIRESTQKIWPVPTNFPAKKANEYGWNFATLTRSTAGHSKFQFNIYTMSCFFIYIKYEMICY